MSILTETPHQLPMFDLRTQCEVCTDLFEAECGYRGCWMGWHTDGKQHPEKALCQQPGENKKKGES